MKGNLYEIPLLLRLFSKPQISSLKTLQSTGKAKFCIFHTSKLPPKMAESTLLRQISLLEFSIFRNSGSPISEPIIPDRSYHLEYFIILELWRNLFPLQSFQSQQETPKILVQKIHMFLWDIKAASK